jgi:hypothetical protein
MQPRRSICPPCANSPGAQKTHVLLPKVALLRRADTVHTIGAALMATHLEKCTRHEVAKRSGAPVDTGRGWRRRFRQRAEQIRVRFTELAHEWDPEQSALAARASPELDALEAIGVAAQAAVRRFGPEPLWQLVAGASGGRLLCNTSSPLPRPPLAEVEHVRDDGRRVRVSPATLRRWPQARINEVRRHRHRRSVCRLPPSHAPGSSWAQRAVGRQG